MRVLVVEDEALLSRQLAEALIAAGYAVDQAGDGERADFLAQTEQYDAVVLDLGLPKVDGLTLLRFPVVKTSSTRAGSGITSRAPGLRMFGNA